MSVTQTTRDTRVTGRSYGYVIVPAGGLTVVGVKFPAGPRAVGKGGWHRLLTEAGCQSITERDYCASVAGESPAGEADTDVRPDPLHRGRRPRTTPAARD